MRTERQTPPNDVVDARIVKRDEQDLARVGAAYARLGRARVSSRRDPGKRFDESMREGTPVDVCLRAIGAPASVIRLLEVSRPPDPTGALSSLIPALSRADARRRGLSAVGSYALLMAMIALLLCVHLVVIIRPQLSRFPGEGTTSALAAHGSWGLIAAALLAVVSLLILVAALKAEAAPWPFIDARRRHACALWLSGAAVLARQGVPLHLAVRASAALISLRTEARAVQDLARDLEQGRTTAHNSGDATSQPIFEMISQAAAAGAGTESLEAMAVWCDRSIDARWPQILVRAELLSLLLAGSTVGASGIVFFDQYLGGAVG